MTHISRESEREKERERGAETKQERERQRERESERETERNTERYTEIRVDSLSCVVKPRSSNFKRRPAADARFKADGESNSSTQFFAALLANFYVKNLGGWAAV